MKIFGYEIRRTPNQPKIFKTGGFFGSGKEKPNTSIQMYYKYFRKNSDAKRCVQEIQESTGTNGFYFLESGEKVENENLASIMNYGRGFRVLKNKIIRDVAIGGNAYIVKLKNESGQLVGLDTIDPRTIRIQADIHGDIIAYEQFMGGKVQQTYMPEDVVNCFDDLDPDNEIFGLSTMEGVIIEILSDNEASLTNYNYFKNNAVPFMLLRASDNASRQELSNTLDQMKREFAGGKNKHKMGILNGIEGIEKVQDGLQDMDFEIMRGFNTNRICAAFGVPKIILGYTDGVNYTNANMQYKKFIDNTIGPWTSKLNMRLTEALGEEGVSVALDSMQYDLDIERIEIMQKKIGAGLMTVNEGRYALGYEPFDLPEADEPLVEKRYEKLEDVGLTDIPLDDS